MNYLALAVAPGLAIILFILFKDRYNKEPRLTLFVSFFLGCLSIIPAAFVEEAFELTMDGTVAGLAIFVYLIVAGSEELGKFIGLRFYSYNRKSFDEPFDGIVHSLMVSMGFATIENILYVLKFAEIGQGLQVGIMRAFMAVPAHGVFAVLMGFYMGKAKFQKNGFGLMLLGLLLAVFFHGTYDFFLFYKTKTYAGTDANELALLGGAVLTLIVGLIISFKLINRQRKQSEQAYRQNLLQQQQQQQQQQQNPGFGA